MTRLIGAELFKLRTTRTFYGIVGAALGLVALISILAAATATFEGPDQPSRPFLDLMGIAGLAGTFALVLGILSVTSEFRHGTVTPTLLVFPERTRLVLAKLAASVGIGLILGLVAFALAAAVISGLLSLRDIDAETTGSDAAKVIAGGAVASALYGGLGVGVGALVRNQVGAIVGTLVYLLVVEPLVGIIPGLDDVVPKYGISGVGGGLSGTGTEGAETLDQLPAGLLLAGYVAVFVAAGIVLVRRRDVTA